MDQIIQQGTLTAFFGWESIFHATCKDTYDRRPPQPFRLWIQHGATIVGPPGVENAQYQMYGADQLMAIPHDEWQPVVHDLVKLWKDQLRRLTLAVAVSTWRPVPPPVVLSESLWMWINDLEVSPIGAIHKSLETFDEAEAVMCYKMVIETPFFNPDFYDDTFSSAIEVCDQVFEVNCDMRGVFLGEHTIQLTLSIEVDNRHPLQFLGDPGASGGPLFSL